MISADEMIKKLEKIFKNSNSLILENGMKLKLPLSKGDADLIDYIYNNNLTLEENMKETKEVIEKICNFLDEKYSEEGFEIHTNKQIIYIGISCAQSCCEDSGYFSTNDDLHEFYGAELLSLERIDKGLIPNLVDILPCGDLDEGDAIFININTNRGLLQFAVYNSHNGYYGHDIFVKSHQLEIVDCI